MGRGGSIQQAIPESRELKKKEIQFFFPSKTALWMSFDIFVVTYRVTNFLLKLVNMLLFSTEKTQFPFFEFPYFRVLPFSIQVLRFARWDVE